ncbi:MAG: zinc-ribbon domain containing protein [Chloroflexota bacterium]
MPYTDKTIACVECGTTFAFTAVEQELYASRGYQNEPKRCTSCRQARKSESGGFQSQRQMFTATCAQCGAETQVPFEPRQGRPVYCSSCYEKVRTAAK